MARGNTRRRTLISDLSLVGQAESISTKSLLEMKAEADRLAAEAAKPKRGRRASQSV